MNLEGIRKFKNGAFLNIDHVLYWKGDLNTVSVVVGSEYDLLQCLDPLFRARRTVCLEEVCPLVRCYCEAYGILPLLFQVRERS